MKRCEIGAPSYTSFCLTMISALVTSDSYPKHTCITPLIL